MDDGRTALHPFTYGWKWSGESMQEVGRGEQGVEPSGGHQDRRRSIPEEDKPTTMSRKRKRENQSKEEAGSPNLLKKNRNQRKIMVEGWKRPKGRKSGQGQELFVCDREQQRRAGC